MGRRSLLRLIFMIPLQGAFQCCLDRVDSIDGFVADKLRTVVMVNVQPFFDAHRGPAIDDRPYRPRIEPQFRDVVERNRPGFGANAGLQSIFLRGWGHGMRFQLFISTLLSGAAPLSSSIVFVSFGARCAVESISNGSQGGSRWPKKRN